jgi:hypothetical protein
MKTKTKIAIAAAVVAAVASPALAVTQESDVADSGRYAAQAGLASAYAQRSDVAKFHRAQPFRSQEEVWFERATGPISAD